MDFSLKTVAADEAGLEALLIACWYAPTMLDMCDLDRKGLADTALAAATEAGVRVRVGPGVEGVAAAEPTESSSLLSTDTDFKLLYALALQLPPREARPSWLPLAGTIDAEAGSGLAAAAPLLLLLLLVLGCVAAGAGAAAAGFFAAAAADPKSEEKMPPFLACAGGCCCCCCGLEAAAAAALPGFEAATGALAAGFPGFASGDTGLAAAAALLCCCAPCEEMRW